MRVTAAPGILKRNLSKKKNERPSEKKGLEKKRNYRSKFECATEQLNRKSRREDCNKIRRHSHTLLTTITSK